MSLTKIIIIMFILLTRLSYIRPSHPIDDPPPFLSHWQLVPRVFLLIPPRKHSVYLSERESFLQPPSSLRPSSEHIGQFSWPSSFFALTHARQTHRHTWVVKVGTNSRENLPCSPHMETWKGKERENG
ncbi:MAG: hypothetical protein BYD32DRAFT_420115 [Podila humilis]|nr:MAG: hypothetical protein BYD32DRAFT_420115 [Podila humilis]